MRITATLTDEQAAWVRAEAERLDRSQAAVVRRCIDAMRSDAQHSTAQHSDAVDAIADLRDRVAALEARVDDEINQQEGGNDASVLVNDAKGPSGTAHVDATPTPDVPESAPQRLDADAVRDTIAAAVGHILDHGGATKRELVAEVMPAHSLGYDVPDLDSGRYRGAWWRKIVRPGLKADDRVVKPPRGASEWRPADSQGDISG